MTKKTGGKRLLEGCEQVRCLFSIPGENGDGSRECSGSMNRTDCMKDIQETELTELLSIDEE